MLLRTIVAFLTVGIAVGALDTDRDEHIFEPAVRTSGRYQDTLELSSVSSMNMGGMQTNVVTKMSMTNEVEVKDEVSGGKSFSIETKHVKMSVKGAGQNIDCDSKVQTRPPECELLFGAVNKVNKFLVDDVGNPAEEGDSNESDASPVAQVGPTQQLQQVARDLQVIPTHPISPGETWDVSVDMGAMGSLEGTAELLGYKLHAGQDCAVIEMYGSFSMNVEELKKMMPGLDGLKVSEAEFSETIYWDDQVKLVRWSQVDQSYDMEMKDPILGSTMKIPVSTQATFTSTEIN